MPAAATTALALIAAATAPQGSATLALDGGVAQRLRDQGVAVARQLVLPVHSGRLGEGASLVLGGKLTLAVHPRRGRARRVTFKDWRATVRTGRTTFSAVSDGRRRVVLGADVPPWRMSLDEGAGTATLRQVRIRLTRGSARLIRVKLGLDSLPAGVLGSAKAAATLRAGSGGGGGTGGGGGGTGGSGGGGGGTTVPGCSPDYGIDPFNPAPPPLARPAGASTITSATIVWRPRETLVRYINAGEGVIASDGATDGPLETRSGQTLVYSFKLELKVPDSWYDPTTRTAALLTRGKVRFHYSGHSIDISLKDPEIELNGGASRAIVTLAGSDCTPLPDTRGLMLNLAATSPEPARPPLAIPATLTADGSAMWSRMYGAGDEWGSFEVAFTAP